VKDKKPYEDLSQLAKDLVLNAGAIDVGIVTTETLKGGPPACRGKLLRHLQAVPVRLCLGPYAPGRKNHHHPGRG